MDTELRSVEETWEKEVFKVCVQLSVHLQSFYSDNINTDNCYMFSLYKTTFQKTIIHSFPTGCEVGWLLPGLSLVAWQQSDTHSWQTLFTDWVQKTNSLCCACNELSPAWQCRLYWDQSQCADVMSDRWSDPIRQETSAAAPYDDERLKRRSSSDLMWVRETLSSSKASGWIIICTVIWERHIHCHLLWIFTHSSSEVQKHLRVNLRWGLQVRSAEDYLLWLWYYMSSD